MVDRFAHQKTNRIDAVLAVAVVQPLPVSYYAKGIEKFRSQMTKYQELYGDLALFAPFRSLINDYMASVEEAVQLIDDHLQGKIDFSSLADSLQQDVALSLESLLDSPPAFFGMLPGGIPSAVEKHLDDMEAFAEAMSEDIQKRGQELYYVLIRAA